MPIKAKNYITVYKVVKRRQQKCYNKRYITPVTKLPVKLYATYRAQHNVKKSTTTLQLYDKKNDPSTHMMVYCVDYGYIHCCTSQASAMEWITRNNYLFRRINKHPSKWGIIRCIIPPGTLYYKSYDGTQICAKTLMTREVVQKG